MRLRSLVLLLVLTAGCAPALTTRQRLDVAAFTACCTPRQDRADMAAQEALRLMLADGTAFEDAVAAITKLSLNAAGRPQTFNRQEAPAISRWGNAGAPTDQPDPGAHLAPPAADVPRLLACLREKGYRVSVAGAPAPGSR